MRRSESLQKKLEKTLEKLRKPEKPRIPHTSNPTIPLVGGEDDEGTGRYGSSLFEQRLGNLASTTTDSETELDEKYPKGTELAPSPIGVRTSKGLSTARPPAKRQRRGIP